jgi:hypothetical protein
VSAPSIVFLVRPDHARALRKRLGSEPTAAVFSDTDALLATDAIVAHPPRVVALDPVFVATARGAALVARMRSEPHLAHVDVRVLTYDENDMPLVLEHQTSVWESLAHRYSLPLDRAGTRLTVRFTVHENVRAAINAEACRLVDLSPTGAQALVATRLRPDQPVRIALSDSSRQVSCSAVVAWSVAEPHGPDMQYRVGLKFLAADGAALEMWVFSVYEASVRAKSTA